MEGRAGSQLNLFGLFGHPRQELVSSTSLEVFVISRAKETESVKMSSEVENSRNTNSIKVKLQPKHTEVTGGSLCRLLQAGKVVFEGLWSHSALSLGCFKLRYLYALKCAAVFRTRRALSCHVCHTCMQCKDNRNVPLVVSHTSNATFTAGGPAELLRAASTQVAES